VAARRALGTAARDVARLRTIVPRKKKAPTAAILDAQSVKTSNHPGVRGYDAGKKVLGRKRHLVVDTLGFILGVLVTPASVTDRQGAAQLLPAVLLRHGWLRQLWADGGYSGSSWIEPLQHLLPRRGLRLETVKRSDGARGFQVQPKRWIVERSFAWLTHARRLVKDYETKTENSTAFILIAASRLMLRRLALSF
jgi:transposase